MTSNPHFAAEKTDLGGEESSQSRAQDARGGCGGNKVLDQVFLSPRPSFAESGGGGPFPGGGPLPSSRASCHLGLDKTPGPSRGCQSL